MIIISSPPFIYNNSFIAETHQNGRSYLSFQNAKDGKLLWKWDDYLYDYDIDLRFPHCSLRILFFNLDQDLIVLIWESGKTQWKKNLNDPFFSISGGIKRSFYFKIILILGNLIPKALYTKFGNRKCKENYSILKILQIEMYRMNLEELQIKSDWKKMGRFIY